jgi:hypothetical protein
MINFAELKEKLCELDVKELNPVNSAYAWSCFNKMDVYLEGLKDQHTKDAKIISELLEIIEMQNKTLDKYKDMVCIFGEFTVAEQFAAKTCLSETESKLKQLIKGV